MACFAPLVYKTEYYMWGNLTRHSITIWPLLFSYICFLIYYRGMKTINSNDITYVVPISRKTEDILYFTCLIMMSIIMISYYAMSTNVVDFSTNYESDAGVTLSNGIFGKLGLYAMIIMGGLNTIVIILPFYLISKPNRTRTDYWKAGLFMFVYILSNFYSARVMGSRGALFFTFVNSGFMFFFFRNILTPSTKRVIAIVGITILFLFIPTVLLISIDRFGDDFVLRICSYFGEPFINFSEIYWNPPKYLNGDYFLSVFRGDGDSMRYIDGRVPLFLFKTLAGSLYVDFGIIGSIIFLLIYSSLFRVFLGKVKGGIYLDQLLVYSFTFLGMIYGIFGLKVLGWSGYTILMMCYLLLRKSRLNKSQKSLSQNKR